MRKVAAATAHLIHLTLRAGFQRDTSTTALRFDSGTRFKLRQNRVLARPLVLEQAWLLIHVDDDHLRMTIAIQVPQCAIPRAGRRALSAGPELW